MNRRFWSTALSPFTIVWRAAIVMALLSLTSLHAAELQRVMVGPVAERSAAQALLRDIQAQGIDAYIMQPTVDGYWLSVGVFRQPDNAVAMQQRLHDLGLNTPSVIVRSLNTPRRSPEHTTPTPASTTAATSAQREEHDGGIIITRPAESAPLIFSAPTTPPAPSPRTATTSLRYGIDRVRLEASGLTQSGRRADSSLYMRAEPYTLWSINETWEARVGARLQGYRQIGEQRVSTADVDMAETYLRYRDPRNRVTLGAQSVVWGRMDELSPNDQLSVANFTRFVLDDIADRRRLVPLLRWEHFRESGNHDWVWIPRFRAAEQADADSIWSLVDRQHGRLPGLSWNPVMAPLISQGRFADAEPDSGAGGWRFSRWQRGLDYAVNIINTPHSVPYFALSEPARTALLASGGNPQAALAAAGNDAVFIAQHPRTWVVGGDLGFEARGVTWRFELAWLSDIPVTRRDTLEMETVEAVRWASGAEFFPGDAELRVSVQLDGRTLLNPGSVLDRRSTVALSGEIEETFVANHWRGRLRFLLGLDETERYLNPELSYIGIEPHEFYLGYHHFSGSERSISGFYQRNDSVIMGIRTRF